MFLEAALEEEELPQTVKVLKNLRENQMIQKHQEKKDLTLL
jgi:hypothetical protein